MKRASLNYKIAMEKQFRDRAYGLVSIGLVNKEAQSDASFTESFYLSNNTTPFKTGAVQHTYAAFEENVIRADGSFLFPPEESEFAQLASDVGFVSQDIMGTARVDFSEPYDFKGLTIDFGDNYPTAFTITNGTDTYSYSFSGGTFTCMDSFDNTTYLIITPTSFVNGNNKRLRINFILMGIGLAFTNDDIVNLSVSESASYVSEELPSINTTIKILDINGLFNVDNQKGFSNYLIDGQDLNISLGQTLADGSIEYIDLPTTYLTDWNADTKSVTFTGADRISLLDGTYSAGNTIHTRTLYDDAIAVLTDAGLEPDEYFVDTCLQDVTVTNPLPTATHAECLQLIANAGRCSLEQGPEGKVLLEGNFENIIEPTELTMSATGEAEWSHVQNTRFGTGIVYADFTRDFIPADGSMLFMPENSSEPYLDTTFVSKQIADSNGSFFDNLLPTPYCGNRVQSGITFTYNNDGSVHAKGTCTADTWYYFHTNGGLNPWMVSKCPWKLGDVVQFDFFIEGEVNGTIGITSGYKVGGDGANQGYIAYRAQAFNMTDSKVRFTDVKRQTIDPNERTGQYLTAYIYVKKDCVIDATISPTLTKREHLDEILVGRQDRFYRSAVNNVWTNRGVTYTLNDDGSILVNGTADGESVCEIINPYSANTRLTFVENHRYVMSEGRKTPADTYHEPFLQLVRYNTDTETYDYSITTRSHGNNTEFTATDTAMMTYGIRIIVPNGKTVDNVLLRPSLIDLDDYDANEVIPAEFRSGNKPTITMELPARYTYYSIIVSFLGNHPRNMRLDTYYDDTLLETFNYTVDSDLFVADGEFWNFNKMVLSFTKGGPHDRILIDKISLGEITNYRLSRFNMNEEPVGTVEKRTKDVQVKVFSFTPPEKAGDDPVQVENSVFYTHRLNTLGQTVRFENQLIGTMEHAERVAKWMGNYYANNISYQVKYRGDPRLDATDIIYLESKVLNNLQVEIESLDLSFDGGYSGTLNVRRAVNTNIAEE